MWQPLKRLSYNMLENCPVVNCRNRWFVRDHRVEFVGLQCERGNYHP